MNITAVTGCFDVPHAGHVLLIEYAAAAGLPVWMGINSDRAIRILKGNGRPIYKEDDRLIIWRAFRLVKAVILVDDIRMTDFLEKFKPKIWVKGSDYTIETLDPQELSTAKSFDCDIRFFPRIGSKSTSETIQKMKG